MAEPNGYKSLLKLETPFYAALGCVIIGFFFQLIAFVSPYWLESFPEANESFMRMGMWTTCFDKFIHPQDYHANVWSGCFWIFDRRFIVQGMWEWLDPYWLIAVQVLVTIAFITQCASVICLILYYLLHGQPAAESTVAFSLQVATSVLMFVSVITFGIKAEDRNWMPRPDHNHLAWAFGFALLAAIAAFMASCFLYCVSKKDRSDQEEVEFYQQYEEQQFRNAPSLMGTGMVMGGPRSVISVPGYIGGSQHNLAIGSPAEQPFITQKVPFGMSMEGPRSIITVPGYSGGSQHNLSVGSPAEQSFILQEPPPGHKSRSEYSEEQ